MGRNFGFQQQQSSSYAMRQESQQQSSYSMRQQAWNSNSNDYHGHVQALQMAPAALSLVGSSQLLKHQAKLHEGFAMGQEGCHGQNMHQNGWFHGFGSAVGKTLPVGANGFSSSSQFSDGSAMFDNAMMGNSEFETLERVRVPAAGAVRMQETMYERSSWGGDDLGHNYHYCFDDGGLNWNRNGAYRRVE